MRLIDYVDIRPMDANPATFPHSNGRTKEVVIEDSLISPSSWPIHGVGLQADLFWDLVTPRRDDMVSDKSLNGGANFDYIAPMVFLTFAAGLPRI